MRAVVIIPRSPTITIRVSPNLSRTTVTASMNAVGSAVLPGNTRIATGRPAGSVSRPYSICALAFLAVAGVATGGQRAVRPSIQEEDRSNSAIRAGFTSGARCRRASLRLDAVLTAQQPVHRRVDLVGGRIGDVQVARRGWCRPTRTAVANFVAGLHHPGDDQRQRQVPLPAGRAQQRGQAQRLRLGHHRGDVPVRQ